MHVEDEAALINAHVNSLKLDPAIRNTYGVVSNKTLGKQNTENTNIISNATTAPKSMK